jgi:hypothetical protein
VHDTMDKLRVPEHSTIAHLHGHRLRPVDGRAPATSSSGKRRTSPLGFRLIGSNSRLKPHRWHRILGAPGLLSPTYSWEQMNRDVASTTAAANLCCMLGRLRQNAHHLTCAD